MSLRSASERARSGSALLAALTLGCSQPARVSETDAGGTAPSSSTTAAPHGPPAPTDAADGGLLARRLPRIVHWGGKFLRHPRIVTVTFKQDDPATVALVERFAETITTTRWWREVSEGYCSPAGECIGPGKAGPRVRLADTLPAALDDGAVEAILQREEKRGSLGVLDPAESIVLVYVPKDVKLTFAGGGSYCEPGKPRAFHRTFAAGTKRVAFAVIPRCGDEGDLTGMASHELLEGTTDPDLQERGFAFKPGAGSAFLFAGTEAVDPCGFLTMDDHRAFDSGFVLHRAWSNRAAAGGHDPCVPAREDRPYFAVVPREIAVHLRRGEDTVSVVLDASADRTVDRWAVSAFDVSGHYQSRSFVDLTLDRSNVGVGESVTLTVRRKEPLPNHSATIGIVSTLGVRSRMWPLTLVER